MDETVPPSKALVAFIACDRCGPNTRSAEVWSKDDGKLLLSFCQSHADRHAIAMWSAGFRPIMKAPTTRDASADDCDTEVVP